MTRRYERVRAPVDDGLDWDWAIPLVFRALAAPDQVARMPAAPRADDALEGALGYWNALVHLLLFSFGWARPDLGMPW